jgi:hypothetical protein
VFFEKHRRAQRIAVVGAMHPAAFYRRNPRAMIGLKMAASRRSMGERSSEILQRQFAGLLMRAGLGRFI